MEQHPVKIISINQVTHDVLRIVVEKPLNYSFLPGQATDVSINITGWEEDRKPFTFTSLPSDEFLEFTIKTYPERERFTAKLLELTTDDELILHDVYGAISYQGDGVFIAGGAGLTPFVSILRDLKRQKSLGRNQLILANKTKSDIIYESEFEELLGPHFMNILSEENSSGFYHGVITSEFLKSVVFSFGHYFYLCGPPPMMEALVLQLKSLGVTDNQIIQEEFN
jgi:ferredoxin-NADP reductase